MTEQLVSRVLAGLAVVAIGAVLIMGLITTGPDVRLGETVRVLYIHPGLAWVAYVAFGLCSLFSLLWIVPKTRALKWDQLAGSCAEIGVIFTALTLLTGSIWGKITWGVWWTWDARTISTALLLFLYLGVLAIRSDPASFDVRARRSAVTSLLAFLNVPIVHFSVTWWRTLHQPPSVLKPGAPDVHGSQLVALLLGFVAFTLVFGWLLLQRYRVARWEDRIASSGIDEAILARRSEAATFGQAIIPGGTQ